MDLELPLGASEPGDLVDELAAENDALRAALTTRIHEVRVLKGTIDGLQKSNRLLGEDKKKLVKKMAVLEEELARHKASVKRLPLMERRRAERRLKK